MKKEVRGDELKGDADVNVCMNATQARRNDANGMGGGRGWAKQG